MMEGSWSVSVPLTNRSRRAKNLGSSGSGTLVQSEAQFLPTPILQKCTGTLLVQWVPIPYIGNQKFNQIKFSQILRHLTLDLGVMLLSFGGFPTGLCPLARLRSLVHGVVIGFLGLLRLSNYTALNKSMLSGIKNYFSKFRSTSVLKESVLAVLSFSGSLRKKAGFKLQGTSFIIRTALRSPLDSIIVAASSHL